MLAFSYGIRNIRNSVSAEFGGHPSVHHPSSNSVYMYCNQFFLLNLFACGLKDSEPDPDSELAPDPRGRKGNGSGSSSQNKAYYTLHHHLQG
jgi:hypothetical protein